MRQLSRFIAAGLLLGLLAVFTPALHPGAASVPTQPTAASSSTTAVTLAAKVSAKKYKNCTALNKKFRHGVGKKSARDKVSGRTKPVTTFKRHDALYKKNKHLDRDRDGVACEKR